MNDQAEGPSHRSRGHRPRKPAPKTNLALKEANQTPVSIPQIPFVVRDAVFLQDSQKFLLERLLFVMFLLAQDVVVDSFVMRRSYTKKPVSIQPMKESQVCV